MGYDNTRDIQWERLRKVLERINFGEVRIIIQNGMPIRVESAVKQIKLDGSEGEFDDGLKTVVL